MTSFMSSWEFNEPNKVIFPTKVILFLGNMKSSCINHFILLNMICCDWYIIKIYVRTILHQSNPIISTNYDNIVSLIF